MRMLTFLLAAAIAAFSLSEPARAGPREAVAAAEGAWTEALVARDAAVFERIVAKEYTLGGVRPGGPVTPRAVWIDNALHHLAVSEARFDALEVDLKGGRATVRGAFYWKGAFDGEAFTDQVHLIDRWVRRDGRWQVVSRRIVEPN